MSQSFQHSFDTSDDAWCRSGSTNETVWDGVDFEPCFRVRLFDGYISLVFLVCSASFGAFHAATTLGAFLRSARRRDYLPVPDDIGAAGATAEGSRPIALAEARVLQEGAESQSPDWTNSRTQEELLGPQHAAHRVREPTEGTASPYAVWQALRSCKKDLLAVAFSFGLAGLGVSSASDGSGMRPAAPEVNASLFSLITFSFLDTFLLGAAFPKRYGIEPISAQTIPDLRPDDKTARVLLAYRQSVRKLEARLSRVPAVVRRRIVPEGTSVEDLALTSKLVYHFWPLLVAQFWWAMLPVFANAIPPIMLNQLLTAIAARQRGEHIPNHVLVLYAWITFMATILVSIGRVMALLTGRRICIRLRFVLPGLQKGTRSLIVGEVFTKALRRKDQAGHSIDSASSPHDPDNKANASGETPSTGPAIELNNRSSVDLSDIEAEDNTSDVAAVVDELEKATSGKIINLISNDTYQLSEIVNQPRLENIEPR
ncbi:hypothetical protein BMF94_4836 [Rhodotorula taiwanensis]|uniref:Uncharacterized protein n=1 Tax=Rhodotorula taiwanensis TaxID=741276 RepID=A0A2S5B5P4_9BASI|nr:hypothetical protein BMF94_4836 [Rhodotorula taiwanensis]